jgi:hypothetical protein
MQIEVYKEESISFKLTNNGEQAVDVFLSVMKKCRKEAFKKGFKTMFDDEEKKFLIEFTDKVLDNNAKENALSS